MKSMIVLAFLAVFCLAVSEAAPKNQCGVYEHVLAKVAEFYKDPSEEKQKDDCFWCVAEIAGTVAGCIAGGWTGVGIVGCVAAAIGTGHDCYDCICYVIEYLGYSCE